MATIHELITDFITEPTRERYLALFEYVTSLPEYNPYGNLLSDAEQLIATDRHDAAAELLDGKLAPWILSPSLHMFLSIIAKKKGDADGAKFEGFFAAACCEGILSTGDGTENSPYRVTCTHDEYDLLAYQQKQMTSQALVERAGRQFDVLRCQDGSELWFDITVPYNTMARHFRKRG